MNRWIDELMNWRQTLNSLQKAMSANHCRFRPSQIICPEIAFCLLSIWFGWSVLIVFLFLSIGFGWSVLRMSFFIHLIWMIWSEIEFFLYIWFGWSILRLHFFIFHTFDLDDLSWDCIFYLLSIWFGWSVLRWHFIFIHLICLSIWFIYPFDWNDLSCDCILIFDLDENFVWYVNNHFNIEIIYSLARTKKWEVSGHDVNGMRGWREAQKVLGSTRSLRTYFINHLPESACHQKVQFCVLRRGNEYLTLKNTWQYWGLISLT